MSLSGLSADTKIHLVFKLRDGRKAWHCGTDRVQHKQTFEWHTIPKLTVVDRESVSMRLDFAIVAHQRWNEMGYAVRLALDANGPFVDDDPTPPEFVADHKAYHAVTGGADVLIVPGSDSHYWIRFPGSAIESLRGDSPEDVLDKYEKTVAVHPQIARFVERYQPPQPQLEQAAAMQPQQAAPQFRRRPGDYSR